MKKSKDEKIQELDQEVDTLYFLLDVIFAWANDSDITDEDFRQFVKKRIMEESGM